MPGTPGQPEIVTAYNFDGTALPVTTEGGIIAARGTLDGRQLVEIGHPQYFSAFTTTAAAAAKLALQAAPGAGLSLYVTDVIFSPNTVASLSLMDDQTTTGEFLVARQLANTTFTHTFRQPKKLTANKPLGYTTDATVTSIHVSGYIAP